MPDPNDLPQNPDDALEFAIEIGTPDRPSDFRRYKAACTVTETGYVITNVNGALVFDQHQTGAGRTVEDLFYMKWGVKDGVIAGYLSAEGQPGAIPVKRVKGERIFAFHLAYLFDNHPELRPTGEILCPLERTTDKTGAPCIKIYVKGAVQKKSRAEKRQAVQEQKPDGETGQSTQSEASTTPSKKTPTK